MLQLEHLDFQSWCGGLDNIEDYYVRNYKMKFPFELGDRVMTPEGVGTVSNTTTSDFGDPRAGIEDKHYHYVNLDNGTYTRFEVKDINKI